MAVYENFERCARRIFEVVKLAQRTNPGAPRHLYLDIQGHKNDEGGYDRDARELMRHFILEFLWPYLSEAHMPIIHIKKNEGQLDDLPDLLSISYPEDENGFWYDAELLPIRSRDLVDGGRKSPPLKSVIADYLGMDVPCCLVCWGEPAERAHVVPTALGGSMNVRNFALLCKRHHEQAPDIADAEGFWAWVDYAEMRDSGSKWQTAPEEMRRWVQEHGGHTDMADRSEAEFLAAVKFELKHLYGWDDADFAEFSWELQHECHHVLEVATGRHFGVEKKVSTYAWAYDVAWYRIERDDNLRDQRRRRIRTYDSIPR
ncbi:HNH endonuclease [Nonomuraea sp. NPDC051941]|uniref:HNH endonuclease n=1 Tax=Nonomuraea sp. NPDC051941 TaxID=3364373 RepID=UPI0037CC8D2A